MRKIRIMDHITLDGVIQAPGGPDEDGDYPYGGWAGPFECPNLPNYDCRYCRSLPSARESFPPSFASTFHESL